MSATARIACTRRRQSVQVAGATSWIDTHNIRGAAVEDASDETSIGDTDTLRLALDGLVAAQQGIVAAQRLGQDLVPVVALGGLAARGLSHADHVAPVDR